MNLQINEKCYLLCTKIHVYHVYIFYYSPTIFFSSSLFLYPVLLALFILNAESVNNCTFFVGAPIYYIDIQAVRTYRKFRYSRRKCSICMYIVLSLFHPSYNYPRIAKSMGRIFKSPGRRKRKGLKMLADLIVS